MPILWMLVSGIIGYSLGTRNEARRSIEAMKMMEKFSAKPPTAPRML